MKITLSHLIAVDRFMDRCGLSFINNLVNGGLKIYLWCMEKESFDGSDLAHHWSAYVNQKEAVSCAFGMIPVIGSIFIEAIERFNEYQGEKAYDKLDEELDDRDIAYLPYSLRYNGGFHAAARYAQVYKTNRLEQAIEDDKEWKELIKAIEDVHEDVLTVYNNLSE